MYFHTDNLATLMWLEGVVSAALDNDQRLRLKVTEDGSLCIKRGEGIWSIPVPSTPDPYRDSSGS